MSDINIIKNLDLQVKLIHGQEILVPEMQLHPLLESGRVDGILKCVAYSSLVHTDISAIPSQQ